MKNSERIFSDNVRKDICAPLSGLSEWERTFILYQIYEHKSISRAQSYGIFLPRI